MRFTCTLVLTAVVAASVPAFLLAGQTSALRACSLLTKDLALSVTSAANKAVFDIIPPEEGRVGANGSACDYGDIRVQIDAFTAAVLERNVQQQPAQWTAVPNVGDRAWFRDNGGQFAELMVVAGQRTLTIQMGVPFQGTAEQVKPNTVTLANALLPRLR